MKIRFKDIMEMLQLKDLYKYLSEETDFLTAPASSCFHGDYEGGLIDHSLAVMDTLLRFTYQFNLEWGIPHSPWLIGLLHDVCKINTYEKVNGVWKNVNPVQEHGILSIKILEEHGVKLTEEEKACIHYHMGPWTKDIDESLGDLSYTQMIDRYPNLLWVHTADMYASQILKI